MRRMAWERAAVGGRKTENEMHHLKEWDSVVAIACVENTASGHEYNMDELYDGCRKRGGFTKGGGVLA
jgi:hypothetical protein